MKVLDGIMSKIVYRIISKFNTLSLHLLQTMSENNIRKINVSQINYKLYFKAKNKIIFRFKNQTSFWENSKINNRADLVGASHQIKRLRPQDKTKPKLLRLLQYMICQYNRPHAVKEKLKLKAMFFFSRALYIINATAVKSDFVFLPKS